MLHLEHFSISRYSVLRIHLIGTNKFFGLDVFLFL